MIFNRLALLAAIFSAPTFSHAFVPSNGRFGRPTNVAPAISASSSSSALCGVKSFLSERFKDKLDLGPTGDILHELENFKQEDGESDGDANVRGLKIALKILEILDDAEDEELANLDDGLVRNDPDADESVMSALDSIKEKIGSAKEKIKEFEKAKGMIEKLLDIHEKRGDNDMQYTYTTYPSHPEYPDIDLSGAMKRLEGAPVKEDWFSAKKMARILRRMIRASRFGYDRDEAVEEREKTKGTEKFYEASFSDDKIGLLNKIPNPFNGLPRPEYTIKNWKKDKFQAGQFLSGVNPVMIRVVTDVDDQLTGEIKAKIGTDKLKKLCDEKKLFYVSYDDLARLEDKWHHAWPEVNNPDATPEQKEELHYLHAPIAVFYLDGENELDFLGIQLTRTFNAPVYTPAEKNKAKWLYAKMSLQNADTNIHEWVSHLANTHLTMEPHFIAIHNVLRGNVSRDAHPLYSFLRPLTIDTLFLNWAARDTLVSYGSDSMGDRFTSAGVGQIMQLIGMQWERYDFFKSSSLPSELESRGFTEDFDMPGYYFRDDGMKLWNMMGKYASDFVDEVYASDADVKGDDRIQEWAHFTSASDKLAVPGFPSSFETKEGLAKVLQVLCWVPSGLHAGVNFPQYDYLMFMPNKPLGLMKPMPHDDDMNEEWIFENTLCDSSQKDLMLTLNSLVLPSTHTVNSLEEEIDASGYGSKAYAAYKKALEEYGKEVEARNEGLEKQGKFPYVYMHPDNCPASIDI